MKNTSLKRWLPLLLAPAAITGMLLVVYALRGIYPFGNTTVITGDLEQTYCAMYTQFWDILHGEQSLFFSWRTGMGMGASVDTIVLSFYSPLNLLFYLVRRENIILFMSFFVLVKLAVAGFTGAWYFQKRFPMLSSFWTAFFGVAYGFSGYALMQYSNTMFLENVMLLPVYVWLVERMIRGGKVWPFAGILFCLILMNPYTAALTCLFTFLIGGASVQFLLPREERGKAVCKLALGAVLGAALTAWATIPAAMQLMGTSRIEYTGEKVLQTFGGYSFQKGMALCLAGFALVLIPRYFLRLFRDGRRKELAFYAFSIGCFLIPLFFSGVDKLLHFGSNIDFPYRYGFLAVFAVLTVCAAALSEEETAVAPLNNRQGKERNQCWLKGIGTCALVLFLYLMVRDGRKVYSYIDWRNGMIGLFTLSAALVYLVAFHLRSKRWRSVLCAIVLLVQTVSYGTACIAPDGEPVRYDTARSTVAWRAGGETMQRNLLARTKNADGTMTLNYAKFMGTASVSVFSTNLSQSMQDAMGKWGYATSTIAVQDVGGTLFSDALLQVKRVVTKSEGILEDSAYTVTGEKAGYYTGESQYTLPFGMVAGPSVLGWNTVGTADCFAVQNAVYQAISGDAAPLFTPIPVDTLDGENTLTVRIEGTKRIYGFNSSLANAAILAKVLHNGETVLETCDYPDAYHDGCYDLGEYTNTQIQIVFTGDASELMETVSLAEMDVPRFAAFTKSAPQTNVTAGNRSLTLQADCEHDGDVLLLPMQYLDGWQVQVDGHPAEKFRVAGALIGVPLAVGAHTVELRYTPAGFWPGLTVAAAALLALCFLCFKERKRPLDAGIPRWLNGAVRVVFTGVWTAAALCVLVAPSLYALLAWYVEMR